MELTETEKEDLKTVLRPLFGPSVDTWDMNERMLELDGKLLSKSQECSRAMDLVPRPYNGFGAKQYVKRELRRIARALVNGKRDLYVTCLRGAAYGMRQDFDMAGMGL